jgi:hypothetical protein
MMLLRLSMCFLPAIWVSGCAAIGAINEKVGSALGSCDKRESLKLLN